jgi:sarcosine oxidase subunit beta
VTSPWPAPRFVEELPAQVDVVVIGGGIVGAATAFFARRAGLRVLLLERRPALCTLTTPVSTGAFRLQFDNPEEIALVRESVEVFDHFAEIAELPGYELRIQKQGYLFCATTPAGVAHQQHFATALRAWGVSDVELLSGDEARYRFPFLSPEIQQARFRAGDGWLDPVRLTLGYARASQAELAVGTPALGFTFAGDRVTGVVTPRGTVACGHVVIAAGPFSGVLAARAGLRLDLRPTIRYKLVVPAAPTVPAGGPMTIHEETAAHWRPGHGGAFALWTAPTTPPSPPLEDVPPSAAFAFGLLDPQSPHSLAQLSPLWRDLWTAGPPAWHVVGGQYTYTPDHWPLLGETEVPGLVLNTGYSGHGIMASTAGSRRVVDALLGRLAAAAQPFRPTRVPAARRFDIL